MAYSNNIGNKARSLYQLKDIGCNVPKFVVLDSEKINLILNDDIEYKTLLYTLAALDIDIYSVRSSPEYSMPGLMSTVLNVGISHESVDKKIQLRTCIQQVKDSYNSKFAILYRKIHNLPDVAPSIIIQKMIFGNNKNSGSGVAFSRNNFGKFEVVYEYKIGVQGEDIVSNKINLDEYDELDSQYINELQITFEKLERYHKHPIEIEFTIEDGILYYLQYRELKINDINIYARIQKDYLSNNLLTGEEVRQNIEYKFRKLHITEMLQCKHDESKVLAQGTAIAPGIVINLPSQNNILFSEKISNELLSELNNAEAVITQMGSLTSHISILCRNMNKPYVVIKDYDLDNLKNIPFILNGYTGCIYELDSTLLTTITKENILDYV